MSHEHVFSVSDDRGGNGLVRCEGRAAGRPKKAFAALPVLPTTQECLHEWSSSGTDEWKQTFPKLALKGKVLHWTYEHMLLYMWEHVAANIQRRLRPGGLPAHVVDQLDLLIDVLAQDLEGRNIDLGECDTLPSAYDIIKSHFLDAIGFPVASDEMYDHLVDAASVGKINIVVVLALLLSDAPLKVVGPSLLPKVHKWTHVLLGYAGSPA